MVKRMKIDPNTVKLVPMTAEMYREYFREYDNDPDLYADMDKYSHYVYSEENVERYIRRQSDLGRIPLAIMYGDEIVGEIIIKNIEAHKCAVMGLALKNAEYKDRGIGTAAEKLAVRFVFDELEIPVLYADTIKKNTRSQHVLEKTGFSMIREDGDFRYYEIRRNKTTADDPKEHGMRKYAFLKEPLKTNDDCIYKIMLYETKEGVYLFGYSSPDAVQSSSDRLYGSLDDLHEEWDELIDEKGWIDLEDPLPDCQHDAFIPLRVKGRDTGDPQWGKFETLSNGIWVEYRPDQE